MFVQHTVNDSVAIVTVAGYINHTNAVQFEEYIASLAKGYSGIIIDCAQLEYISSTGIGALIYAQRQVESAGGTVALCNCNTEVHTILKIVGLQINHYATCDEAMQAIHNQKIELEQVHSKEKISSSKASGMNIEVSSDIQPISQPHTTVQFEHPIIIECPRCKLMLRIFAQGKYKCPDCNNEFMVDEDYTVYFN